METCKETGESSTTHTTHTHIYIPHTFTNNPSIQEAGLYQVQKEALWVAEIIAVPPPTGYSSPPMHRSFITPMLWV